VAWISRLLKTIGLLAKEPYKRDYILQKRPIDLRSLLFVATPYSRNIQHTFKTHPTHIQNTSMPHSRHIQHTFKHTFKTYSRHLHHTFKTHPTHVQHTSKTHSTHIQRTFKTLKGPPEPVMGAPKLCCICVGEGAAQGGGGGGGAGGGGGGGLREGARVSVP